MKIAISLALLTCLCILLHFNHINAKSSKLANVNKLQNAIYQENESFSNNNILKLMRGGVLKNSKKQKEKKKSILKKGMEVLNQVLPVTRSFLILIMFCTAVHLTGLPAQTLFNIDASRFYEVWRPFTSVSYFGAPSMQMANSIYFLVRYGQTLEQENGTGEHLWFLLTQTFILGLLGALLGFPYQAQAMIAAIIHVCSRIRPMEKIPIQFGLVVTSWQLPFCMMVIDCLSQQSAAAAWPHVLGIFSGHCYHFYTKVWPSLGGRAWLKPPKSIIKKFGGRPTSNIKGLDFRKDKDDESSGGKSNKFKMKKKGKGRKLTST